MFCVNFRSVIEFCERNENADVGGGGNNFSCLFLFPAPALLASSAEENARLEEI